MDDFWRSEEPADWETPLRRGYYTNYYRGDVIWHYRDEMRQSVWPGVSLPTVRLSDYPPEDAFWLVRDQTHVNWLEELVHPMRESVFVAGQESGDPLEYFVREGRRFDNKVTIKYVVSPEVVRVVVGLLGLWLGLYLVEELIMESKRAS